MTTKPEQGKAEVQQEIAKVRTAGSTYLPGEEAWAEEALQCKTKPQMVTLLRAFAANMKAHRDLALVTQTQKEGQDNKNTDCGEAAGWELKKAGDALDVPQTPLA